MTDDAPSKEAGDAPRDTTGADVAKDAKPEAAPAPEGSITVNGRVYVPHDQAAAAPAPSPAPSKPDGPVPLYTRDDQGRFVPVSPGDGFKAPEKDGGEGEKKFAGGTPPASTDGALTMEQIRQMSAKDINNRWDDVKKALER